MIVSLLDMKKDNISKIISKDLRMSEKEEDWKSLFIHLILLKGIIKGTRFEVMESIKRTVMTQQSDIPLGSFQQKCD